MKMVVLIFLGTSDFSVDSSTGEVILLTTASLDRETTGSYELLIEVKDGGTPSLSVTATVSIIITGMFHINIYV